MYLLQNLRKQCLAAPLLERDVTVEQWAQVLDAFIVKFLTSLPLMMLAVTDNHCLGLLFHYVLESGNFLFIVREICSMAPFSTLLLAIVVFLSFFP